MENMTFNEYLYKQYGIFSDDLTDEDYDVLYLQYLCEMKEE